MPSELTGGKLTLAIRMPLSHPRRKAKARLQEAEESGTHSGVRWPVLSDVWAEGRSRGRPGAVAGQEGNTAPSVPVLVSFASRVVFTQKRSLKGSCEELS